MQTNKTKCLETSRPNMCHASTVEVVLPLALGTLFKRQGCSCHDHDSTNQRALDSYVVVHISSFGCVICIIFFSGINRILIEKKLTLLRERVRERERER